MGQRWNPRCIRENIFPVIPDNTEQAPGAILRALYVT